MKFSDNSLHKFWNLKIFILVVCWLSSLIVFYCVRHQAKFLIQDIQVRCQCVCVLDVLQIFVNSPIILLLAIRTRHVQKLGNLIFNWSKLLRPFKTVFFSPYIDVYVLAM